MFKISKRMNDFSCNISHVGDTMNPSSRRSTRENAVNKESIDTKNKSKPAVISYDYEAAISQPDIPSKIDNNTQNPSWSDFNDGLSESIKKKKLYTREKANVTTKKKSTIFKSKLQTKRIHPQQICNVVKIKKESIPSDIIRDTKNLGKEHIDVITASRETPFDFHQNLMSSRDIQKRSEVAENDKSIMNVIAYACEETENLYKENSNKIDKDARLCISQNKTSKIPRIKPNFFPAYEESHICSDRKMPMKDESKYSINMKSPTKCSEEKNFSKLEKILKEESLKIADYQNVKVNSILQTVHENSINLWYPEKSSEVDADEELEEDSPLIESPISTGDNPRSVTLLKNLALKYDCHTSRCTETESWSSPETKSTKRWKKKPINHRKLIDMNSEDLDLMSDYNVLNYKNAHSNRKNNRSSNFANHVVKSSLAKSAKIQTYRTTNFSFLNVFFDIVFWPFIFFRAKQ